MFDNYLKIALRNLIRHKVFSFINIFGLALGMACTILIFMWISDELSYDTFLDNSHNIYRINTEINFGGTDQDMPLTSDMMGPIVKQDYPQIKEYTRIYTFSSNKLVRNGNIYFNEDKTAYADSTFFKVFNFPAIAGNTMSALDEPNTVVINESTAKKYFGNTNVIGRTIETNDNNKTVFNITAVIRDMPQNSHFNFDFIFSIKNLDYTFGKFMSSNFYTYLLLKNGTDYKEFEKNFRQYVIKYEWPYAMKLLNGESLSDFEKSGNILKHTLTPLTKIHLYSNSRFEMGVNGSIQYIYIFTSIALFILLFACINFMNLTTAGSAKRAREVGIRKVLGTDRKNLIVQFLTESVIVSYFAIILSIVLVYLLLPVFNSISGKSLLFSSLLSPIVLLVLIIAPAVVGVLAGSYPAFFLSAFKPVTVLKGRLLSGKKGGILRGSLVVFQLTASIILIIGTIVIYRQLNYVQNKNLGYNKDQVLIIDGTTELKNNITAFKNEMMRIPGVKMGTVSGFLPVPSERNGFVFFKDAAMDLSGGINAQRWVVDYDYINFMGMKITKGRNFSDAFGSDTTAVIINEAAARQLGSANIIGENIYTLDGKDLKTHVSYKIIGVVNDFHFESLRQPIGALFLLLGKSSGASAFRIDAAKTNTILKQAESNWNKMAPGFPFDYRFMDESFYKVYGAEQKTGLNVLAFSILAILIACLGLFGLSIFMAQQKTKEIGIRKTLGASVFSVILLISKEFLNCLVIANLIAWPVAWYFMNKWLREFAYRIELTWWIFAFAGGITLLIALASVGYQALKAANANPVESLRYE
jgi:putative ABC transport system permease protein